MSFCSFSKDNIRSGKTFLDNTFISNYLPDAPDNAVKVYLYGLYLCQNSETTSDVTAFAEILGISIDEVVDCFKYWDDYGLVSIVSQEPFSVRYHQINDTTAKYRRLNPEKYEDFTKNVQSIITERMISVTEFNEYFNLMENTTLKPEAFLLLIKYCAEIKGANIGYKYVLTVAKDFISRGITTPELIERELDGYFVSSSDISEVFKHLKSTKTPEIEDMQAYKHWTTKLGFEHQFILDVIKISKTKTFKKLDKVMDELYSNKCFVISDAEKYFSAKKELYELASEITKKLGLYVEVLDNVLSSYVSPWLAKGFNGETLLFIADYCFRKNKRTFELMDQTVKTLHKLGLITIQSITLYVEKFNKNDEFIEKFLKFAGVERKANFWDRENLENWRSWNFTDDMILEASKRSSHTSNPVAYMNSILSNWKSMGVFTVSDIPKTQPQKQNSAHFENERKYTREELDEVFEAFEKFEV